MSAIRRPDDLLTYEHVLDALNCGAALLDRDGKLIHVNKRLAAIMQRTITELTGANIRDFYTAADEIAYLDSALARSDEPRDAEFVLPRRDGSRVPVVTSARPLPAPFDHLHVVTIVDITKQEDSRQDLQESVALLTQIGDNALEHALDLKGYSEALEKKVRERTEELRLAHLDAIYMLAVASEAKDQDTGRHVRRIQRFAESLSRRLGIRDEEAAAIGQAAILHDVGKIHIPDSILKKPGPLDEEERFIIRQHTLYGERILSKRPFFDRARRIARSHHENWDGSGYPDGLATQNIPIESRIVRVVDVYDALTSARVYKPAWTMQEAADFIAKSRGALFDPDTADAFAAMIADDEVARIAQTLDVHPEL